MAERQLVYRGGVAAPLVWLAVLTVGLVAGGRGIAAAGPGTFRVRDYDAVGDGKTLDTAAINKAIEACAAAGGGQVVLSPGRYLSGTIQLRSKVTMLLEAGAALVGTTELNGYRHFTPPAGTPEARFNPHWHRALILADGAEEVAIVGQGVIDGGRVFDPAGEEKMRGPHTILLGRCRDVTIRDVSIRDSANYAVLLEDCQQVDVRNVKITGGWDGVHFRGWPGRPCRDVTIAGCHFFTGDDAIAGRYWENVLITDCIVNSSCNGLRLIGPATHLIVHDCLFYGPGVYEHRTSRRHNMLAGVCLQPGAWDATQGRLDDVLISDVTMRDVSTPLHLAVYPGNTAGRITVSRLSASGVYRAACSVESWAEEPIERVALRDCSIEFAGGGTLEQARLAVNKPGVDARALPAWGCYARRVQQLQCDGVRLSCAQDDLRPVLICDEVGRLQLRGFAFPRAAGAADPLVLNKVGQVERDASRSHAAEPAREPAEQPRRSPN